MEEQDKRNGKKGREGGGGEVRVDIGEREDRRNCNGGRVIKKGEGRTGKNAGRKSGWGGGGGGEGVC